MSPSKSLFILGLLFNVGCLAKHSPVRREVSVKADGNVQAESQSRSLADLANILPEEEAQQAQSLLMLAKEGAPKDELTKMVSDLKSKIPPWRTDAMATLQKSIDAIEQCDTKMKGAVAQWPEKKNQCDAQGDSHTSCREEESKKSHDMTQWKGSKAEKKEVMDTECKIFDDVKKEVRAARASYTSGDEEAYLEGVCSEFNALEPRYEDAKQKCTAAKTDYARVVEIYEEAESAYIAEKKVCDEKQTQAEVSYCQYALTTKGTCDAYSTCYEDKVAEYKKVKEIVEGEEKLNKVEWRVYSRIECLLPLLGTDKADEIEKCRKKTYSLEDIAYPDVPGQDACTIEAAYPGTNAYYTAHMAPLPEDAKGSPVAQCVGLAQSQEVASVASHSSGYRFWKLEMRQNDNPTCQVFQEIEFICNGEKRTGVNALEASGDYLAYHASKAVDGNEQTYWAKCFGGQGAVDWITFDLGTPCSLTDVKTKSRASKWAQMQPDVMLLQASATGEDGTWEDVHEWNNPNNPNWQEIAIPEGAGR